MNAQLVLTARHADRIIAAVTAILDDLAPKATAHSSAAERRLRLFEALLGDHDHAQRQDLKLPDLMLAERFGLDDMDLALLWFVAAPHLDPELHDRIARANNDLRFNEVDLALVLRAFADERTEEMALLGELGPGGRLVERGLVEIVGGERAKKNRLFASLLPGDHVVSFLQGIRAVSSSALPYCDWLTPSVSLDTLQIPGAFRRELAPTVSAFYRRAPVRDGWLGASGLRATAGLGLVVYGAEGTGRATAVRALAGTLERAVIQVDGRLLGLAALEEQRACLRSVLREGELFGDLVCVRDADKLVLPGSTLAPFIGRELERREVVCVFCAHESALDPSLERVVLLKHRFEPSATAEQSALTWMTTFPAGRARLADTTFRALVASLSLSPLQMRKASQLAYLATEDAVREDDHIVALVPSKIIERAARAQLSQDIGGLATVVEPRLCREDLILDDTTSERIDAIIGAARSRSTVLEDWGLGARIHRGTGLVSLFDGDPGTGKTHAAEVIAHELGLSLVHVNVSSVVDKYIGETEKNLTRIFREVRPDLSLILFDEADSLFSKRTKEVERATDRYSNMDINVMLQLIERYPGVSILTTNLKKAIDPAFERRFAFKVTFDLPKAAERARIWRHYLGPDVRVGEPIDFDTLASVTLSGGEIKNALLRASYAAASRGALLTTRELFVAAQAEASAAGRLVRLHG